MEFRENYTMQENKNENYVLIDSSGILFHQYYGMKNTPYIVNIMGKDVDLSGIIGYLRFIKKLKEEYNVPNNQFIHILDPNNGSAYRKALFPEYKANRSEKEEALVMQKNLLGHFLLALGEVFLQIDGVESDDVIGSLSHQFEQQGSYSLIVSYDKDLLQLLSPHTMMSRFEKIGDTKKFNLYTEEYVYKKYGFPPETMVDYLALVGDVSDNIPGVKGIGDVAATALLREYLNIEGILSHLNEIKPVWKKKIETQVDNMILSKKLALIQKHFEISMIQPVLPEQLKANLLKIVSDYWN